MPCANHNAHQFDFWVGNWEVKDGGGNLVGHNRVERILGGCAISENWQSSSDNRGVSYNFYDALTNSWHQTWVDDSGGSLFLDGGLHNGVMVLAGQRPGKEGGLIEHEISWTLLDDGRVKQHWRASRDGGKSWNDAFVGFYSRVEKVANR
ncbi:MAG: hypothetical protein HOC23_21720 [Halieaceae bacterium]|nr:hypothetical protein [Halieaceae bacterium]